MSRIAGKKPLFDKRSGVRILAALALVSIVGVSLILTKQPPMVIALYAIVCFSLLYVLLGSVYGRFRGERA